jgi:hypothetical protein
LVLEDDFEDSSVCAHVEDTMLPGVKDRFLVAKTMPTLLNTFQLSGNQLH